MPICHKAQSLLWGFEESGVHYLSLIVYSYHPGIHSRNQSNEGTISCSMKQREPLKGLEL